MTTTTDKPRYAIGHKFTPVGKVRREYTVVDILWTYNSAGECVKVRYVATHEFMGQLLTDYDVPEITVARGSA